jgi:hypothetical protein
VPHRSRDLACREHGFTFVEVVCVVCFLALGLMALAAAIGSGMGTVAINREMDLAAQAARERLEKLQDPDGLEFEQLFAAYNSDPDDDPPGVGAPGGTFPVDGLRGSLGEILFPVEGSELREDVALRDLNGDALLDSEDHASDYVLLPVTVRIRWTGAKGDETVEFATVLAKR